MAKSVVLDEVHLTIRIPSCLPDERSEEIARTLAGVDFMTRLHRAVRAALRAFPELAVVRVSLTR